MTAFVSGELSLSTLTCHTPFSKEASHAKTILETGGLQTSRWRPRPIGHTLSLTIADSECQIYQQKQSTVSLGCRYLLANLLQKFRVFYCEHLVCSEMKKKQKALLSLKVQLSLVLHIP
jgi:hypothetical protein